MSEKNKDKTSFSALERRKPQRDEAVTYVVTVASRVQLKFVFVFSFFSFVF
jgi:hypothetical protein